MDEHDWHTLRALHEVAADVEAISPEEVDLELHAAIDAVLLAARLCGGWRLVVSVLWLAYRAGVVVGRRSR